ncbi:TPA: hypothetical protein DCZ46_00410 [Candidatus Campbellbacteria bacterium]|nr:MAG: TPR repeat protein [Candidatus Campbellbacteria bacterium GW2011_OD1_34_28]KKP75448.1 MAG: hypothetical protein UR74_C0001G0304 [Candidatus Campbellbacteria bacterium GW2011_GWD2_35_24]KKP75991.1 MAG: hypothetical protein UR75_C0001G0025 [Candidatus Campbellbacteria bacterium GW2011_GWC2_35_28]KKP77180.1 MAG: hypothetical protein UR76_C0001G0025 [Candidatus Campbellbacteria bacterium GW2011_GWC1_35_31]KKP79109.1 MAG: hypothetical protein UR79_C0001G0025 [Candidatus Campbellbacteria bact
MSERIINKIKKIFISLRVIFIKNDLERWKNVSEKSPTAWYERNRLIAKIIPDKSRVLDIGCGDQNLRSFLKKDCEYQPCDLIANRTGVLFCDFNSNIYPSVNYQYDYVILSGVLEYARNPKDAIEQLSRYGEHMIISYSHFDKEKSKLERLNKGWVNNLTEDNLNELFVRDNLKLIEKYKWNDQIIYLVKKNYGK